MFKVSKILVPIDLSDCSRSALSHALSLAEQFGASIDALFVAEIPAFRSEPRVAKEGGTVSLRAYAIEVATADLDTFLGHLEPTQRERVSARVDAGKPRECILQHAQRDHHDLIVMGTHGRTGRVHSFAGSVAESIVRSAPCAVLTVRGAY